jgi:PII-like signaling protein
MTVVSSDVWQGCATSSFRVTDLVQVVVEGIDLEQNVSLILKVLREIVQSQQWKGKCRENLFLFPPA